MSRTRRYPFVTVAHEADYGLLWLQARSMARFANRSLVKKIWIIENFSHGAYLDWRGSIREQYAGLADLVEFIPASELLPPMPAHGWWTQQFAKLAVADVIADAGDERYVTIDAKNHLVLPLRLDFLEAPKDGRPMLNGYSFESHPLRHNLEAVLDYFGLERTRYLSFFNRTSTPFTFITDYVLDMRRYIEQRDGKYFGEAMGMRQMTEYLTYSGFLLTQPATAGSYDLTQPHTAQIWPEDSHPKGVLAATEKFAREAAPFFSVHREAIRTFDDSSRRLLSTFYSEQQLFPSASEAEQFLRDPNGYATAHTPAKFAT
jgi:hypothetical protein